MKETIKKSVIGGVTFFLTVGILYIVYAATYSLPATVGTGTPLSSVEWNKMVGSLEYLKTTSDSLQTQINTTNAKFTPEAWIAPTLTNFWANYGSPFSTAGYYKDSFGIIHIKGLIRYGTIGTCAFTLPTGYRPINGNIFNVISNGILGKVSISGDGCVFINSGDNDWVSLSGISFRAEQ